MLSDSDPLEASSLKVLEPLSFGEGVPDSVRLSLSTSSHDGAPESVYLVSESLWEKVPGANTYLKGCETRATGGNCALMG